MAKDKDYNRLIHTVRWLRLRRDALTRNPLCERCREQGRVRAATEVHHVVPVEHGLTLAEKSALMYDAANLRALCHQCHVEEHKAMGKAGKAATRRLNAEKLARFRKKYVENPDFSDEGGGPLFSEGGQGS